MPPSYWAILQQMAPSGPSGKCIAWSAGAAEIVAACVATRLQITPTHVGIIMQYGNSLAVGFPWTIEQGVDGRWHFKCR